MKTATRKILATKTATLPVPLTAAELQKVAEEMGRVEGDLRAFYATKKEISADLKSKEERLDAEMGRLGRLQRDKQEYRPSTASHLSPKPCWRSLIFGSGGPA